MTTDRPGPACRRSAETAAAHRRAAGDASPTLLSIWPFAVETIARATTSKSVGSTAIRWSATDPVIVIAGSATYSRLILA